ncbi:MAG: DEAD/DEAH box helicase family protein [Candidatus Woesearchaeota archaeon]
MHLDQYIILNKYILSQLGFSSSKDLFNMIKDTKEGFDPTNGLSYFIQTIKDNKGKKIEESKLDEYDGRIKQYYETIKQKRDNFNLKYFQYLAVLFTEIYLDNYFNKHNDFIENLNSYLEKLKKEEGSNGKNPIHKIQEFTENDLRKIAFWMATGSGKTLIMHINYYQILNHSKKVNNIILVTPNEVMSKQHIEELSKSGINCRMYNEEQNIFSSVNDKPVLVIDIHKLKFQKKGSGTTIKPSAFGSNNIVFIDEGHKGQGSEEKTWKRLREELGKSGFIFEYSATFGQVINPNETKNDDVDIFSEYAKAIIYDYSYKYFYDDGFGKDFFVFNMKLKSQNSVISNEEDIVLTANLLAYLEQLLIFENKKSELSNYNIEKPLWAFIGSSVSGKGIQSDVVKVVEFLSKSAKESNSFLKKTIKNILTGKSGFLNDNGKDAFEGYFKYLRSNLLQNSNNYDKVVEDIFKFIFNSSSVNSSFSIYEIKSSSSEIGIKVGDSSPYFAVINIGDVNEFKKQLSKKKLEIASDNFTPSLFDSINTPNSPINIVIGAKKFIEGWDSWRVSSMGLINMGKGEGSQIIQLFGRGVRLKGKDFSLKRETNTTCSSEYIKTLQTLFIYGLNANYINTFLEVIQKEEVNYEVIDLPLKRLNENEWKGLLTLRQKEEFDFRNHFFNLTYDENILKTIRINLTSPITLKEGSSITKISPTSAGEQNEVKLSEYLSIINLDLVYLKALEFKSRSGFSNLIITKSTICDIISSGHYKIEVFNWNENNLSYNDITVIHTFCLLVLESYVDKFVKKTYKGLITKNMKLDCLTSDDDNLALQNYKIKITVKDTQREKEIECISL